MGQYELRHGVVKICDEELAIDLEESHDATHFVIERQLTGSDTYHFFSLLDGALHGPSFFYTLDGRLLSCAWFFRGMRYGRVQQYYPTGMLYASLGFKMGKRQGEHRYYYPDGTLRTLMHYTEGRLEKELILFWPNGQKKRHVELGQGINNRKETFWDESGKISKELHRSF